MRARFAVDEGRFRLLTYVTLAALSVIVLTGALVRLTDSGLGCPTWPRCYGHVYPPVALHPLIEFGNRAISGFVGVITAVVFVAACRLRPLRKDLIWLSAALPAGVIGQAVLGGFTVREKLAPGFVMSHFLLSMVILIFAFWLAWRATYAQGARPRTADRLLAWSVRGLAVLCGVTLFAGTAATAAGPHSGGNVGQHIKRLTIEGPDTLQWAVHQHATIAALFGIATILVWLLKRKRTGGALDPLEPLTVLGILLAAQGLVGSVQYELKLPGEMVWVHIILATVTWLVCLWAAAVEGRIGDPQAVENEEAIATIVAEWSRSVPAS
jgi:cytochrome c oxidase assembly protein subunit 15